MGKLASQKIPSLFGGISRQPHNVRRVNQVETCDNALNSVVSGGFEKRPASQVVGQLSGFNSALIYAVFHIDRDPTEQTFVAVSSGEISTWNSITGVQRTITVGDTKKYTQINNTGIDSTGTKNNHQGYASTHLAFGSGETEIVWSWALSNASVIFTIEGSADNSSWNTLSSGRTGATGTVTTTIGAVVPNDHNYIRLNITTAGGASDTITLSGLFNDLSYLLHENPASTILSTDFEFVAVADHAFIVNRTVTARMEEPDGGTITGTVQSFSGVNGLPSATGTGNRYRVQGDDGSVFVSYVVRDDPATSTWIEVADPTIANEIADCTMPHELTRASDGTYTLAAAPWLPRAAGDATLQPEPPFIGKQIRALEFYKNRLCVLADENVYTTESGGLYDFWPDKATISLDTDPIDRVVSTNQVSILQHAATYRKILFATAENNQFEFHSGNVPLTPTSASLDQATSYQTSALSKPVTMGDALYFAAATPGGSVIYEYQFSEATLANVATDVTKHVRNLIPIDVVQMAADATTGTLFVVTEGERNSVFCYKVFYDGTKKVLSSWGRYSFGAAESVTFIHGIATASGFLVILLERDDGEFYIEQVPIEREAPNTTLNYAPMLDAREVLTGVHDATNDVTTWTTVGEAPLDDWVVVLGPSFSEPGRQFGSAFATQYTLTLASVTAGQTVTIAGLTFTADASTTTTAAREFSISGDDSADAVELAAVINDPTTGVPNALASTSGAVLTLTAAGGDVQLPTVPTTITLVSVHNARFFPDQYTLTLTNVLDANSLVVGGNTYNAHATTTTTANREFSISGDDTADAVELAIVLNDATTGVSGVTATASGAVVNLLVDDAADGTLAAPSSLPSTIVLDTIYDKVAVRGDYDTNTSWVGRPFTMLVELSKLYPREKPDAPAIIDGRTQLRQITFEHEDTGGYRVTHKPVGSAQSGRATVTKKFNAWLPGADNTPGTGDVERQGSFSVPLQGASRDTVIQIINDYVVPSVITSAEWLGFFNEVSRSE